MSRCKNIELSLMNCVPEGITAATTPIFGLIKLKESWRDNFYKCLYFNLQHKPHYSLLLTCRWSVFRIGILFWKRNHTTSGDFLYLDSPSGSAGWWRWSAHAWYRRLIVWGRNILLIRQYSLDLLQMNNHWLQWSEESVASTVIYCQYKTMTSCYTVMSSWWSNQINIWFCMMMSERRGTESPSLSWTLSGGMLSTFTPSCHSEREEKHEIYFYFYFTLFTVWLKTKKQLYN